jgi:hypothetical protein
MCYKFLTSNETILRLFRGTDTGQVVTGDFANRVLGLRKYFEGTALTGCSNKVVMYGDGF